MKTKIVMGMFASLALLFTACAALGLYPEMRFVDPNTSSGCAAWTRGGIEAPPVTLYDRPGGAVLGTIPRVFDYAFYPVEWVYFDGYHYKVWVYGDIIEPEGGVVFPQEGRYVWIKQWEIDEGRIHGCSDLPFPDGIEGMVCDIHLPGPYSIPARVGPGGDYPIRRYLTADESGGQVHIDGYVNVGGDFWYRIAYDGEHLWIMSDDLDNDRDQVEACTIEVRMPPAAVSPLPPVLEEAPIETAISWEDFAVYHCRHLGSNDFEWYSARVTYDASGTPIREEITGGPFTGTWVEHCPAGEQSSPPQEPNSGDLNRPSDPPSGEPTQTPSPTPCDDGC